MLLSACKGVSRNWLPGSSFWTTDLSCQ